MSENNNEQLTLANALKSMGVQNNNALVNEAFSNLNGVEVVDNLKEYHDVYSKPFTDSDMSVGSAIGGSYQLGVATIYREEGMRWKNKAYIFDDFTIQKLNQDTIEHLYFTNGIYATAKTLVIEQAGKYARENNYDEYGFAKTTKNYQMRKALFDFYHNGVKMETKMIEIDSKKIFQCTKDNLRGFTGYDIDIDNVDYERACNLCNDIENHVIPKPTFIVVTGTGVHLKYTFPEPVALKNNAEIEKYETMQGLFSRKFTHNPRYCGKEEETGSFQHDLPLGQLMRAVGNMYDKISGCRVRTECYTSGLYHNINDLNRWADIPEIEIIKKPAVLKYDSSKARKLSQSEYNKLYNSFIIESLGHRTQHRNLLFHHMLVEGGMSFENALAEINRMTGELNRLYPVEGNAVRLLTEKEAKTYDPNSDTFNIAYYFKYLSVGAMVNHFIYKKHIRVEKRRTGLNTSENMKKVNQEIVHNIGLRAECLMYALVNTLNNDRENKSGVAEYHGQQCIIGGYDFTPFVMAHSNTYNLGKDGKQRTVKNSYKIIDNPDTERHQVVLARVFAYLNGETVQVVGSTDIYSNSQQLIHNLLLESTAQTVRDEFFNRYVNVTVPRRYTINSEELYRDINNYCNILLSLVHHHMEKIQVGVQAEHAYMTGGVLAENKDKAYKAILRITELLKAFNVKREEIFRAGTDLQLIAEIKKTMQKSESFISKLQQLEKEALNRHMQLVTLQFADKSLCVHERLDMYENILREVGKNDIDLDYESIFNIWLGIKALNKQSMADEQLLKREVEQRWNSLLPLLPIIQKIDSLIVNKINRNKPSKRRLHNTFMYTCFLRGFYGFYDLLANEVKFPFIKLSKHIEENDTDLMGTEHTTIGRRLLNYDNTQKAWRPIRAITDFKTFKEEDIDCFCTEFEQIIMIAKYWQLKNRDMDNDNILRLSIRLLSTLENEQPTEDDTLTRS